MEYNDVEGITKVIAIQHNSNGSISIKGTSVEYNNVEGINKVIAIQLNSNESISIKGTSSKRIRDDKEGIETEGIKCTHI